MAKPSLSFIAALRRYGAESDENKDQLIAWKAAALTAISEGNGGQIISGSGNGVTFQQTSGMTNLEWFETLDSALQYLAAGLTPSSRTIARIV